MHAPRSATCPGAFSERQRMLAVGSRRAPTVLSLLSLQLVSSMASPVSWDSIKHKFIGGPYAGAGGMAAGGGSVGVEAFKDDAEAIKAIRLFPDVVSSFGGLNPATATDDDIKQKFLPALKVMLPHGGYFHDTLYNIRVQDENTITCTTGDMQLTAPRHGKAWGVPKAGMNVFTTMRALDDKVEMDLHGIEKWAWITSQRRRLATSPEQ